MLTKKMLRDMGRHKTQFLSIFLMAFLAIYIYTGVGGEWRGLVKSADDYYAETNLADVWLYGNGFSDGQVEAILSVPGVTSAERRLEMTAVADLDGTPKVDLMFVESSTISAMYLTDGFPFDIDDANGVWLSKRFADARGIAVGDTLKVIVSGMTFEKTIRGLVYSPEQVYEYNSDAVTEDFSLHGFAYLSEKAFPVPAMFTYSSMMITGESSEADIDTALDGKYRVYLARKDHPSVSTFAAEFDQHKMMGDVFPVVFLLIALLTMMTTMTRLVNNQRIQIGTLKALGFTKGSILRHYVSYGFWLTLLGAVTGLIAGPITLPRLFYPSMSAFYTVPTWKPAYSAEFILMAAAIVALSTAVCWYSCAKLLRDTPADTLRSKTPKSFKHGFLERAKIWGRLGFNAQWNIRDASRNPARSVMAVIGVFGCTILVVCAFAMNDATNDLKAWQFEKVQRYESKLNLSETVTDEQIADVIAAVNGEPIMECRIEAKANGVKKTGALLVTDDTTLIQATGLRLEPVSLPNDGISITEKFAELLGVKAGDTVSWHIYGSENWTESAIAAIYRDAVNQGLQMSRATLERAGFEYKAISVLPAETITDKYDGVESITLKSDSIAGWDSLADAMVLMTIVLVIAATILAVVVLYNLGLLSFTEMERELATLKVMGLKTRLLRGLLLTQNLWFSAVGFALGVPGGLWLLTAIVKTSGDDFDYPVSLHISTFFISLAFTFGLSVLVTLMFSRKIRRLNMAESLKAME